MRDDALMKKHFFFSVILFAITKCWTNPFFFQISFQILSSYLKSISNNNNNNNKMRNTSLLAAPAEPVIENDLPLDLSCNSRRRSEDEEDEGKIKS